MTCTFPYYEADEEEKVLLRMYLILTYAFTTYQVLCLEFRKPKDRKKDIKSFQQWLSTLDESKLKEAAMRLGFPDIY
jgi:hypothetical protein